MSGSDTSSQIAAVDAAIAAASTELAARRVAERADSTPATRAAVVALTERVASLQSELASLLYALPRPVAVTPPPVVAPSGGGASTTGGGGGSPPLPGSPGGPSEGPPSGGGSGSGGGGGGGSGSSKGGGKFSPPPNFLGEVVPPYALLGIGAVTGPPAVGDAWNYFRDVIDGDFTDLESAFESIGGSALASGTDVTVTEVGLGVTGDVAAVDVVGLAAAVLLGEYATGWIIQKVGQYFPDPSLFGWRPLNFISKGLENLGGQFESSAKGLAQPIVDVVTQPFRQLLGLFQRGANATASAHNKIAHVVTHSIPEGVAKALTDPTVLAPALVQYVTEPAAAALNRLSGALTESRAKSLLADAQRFGGLEWDLVGIAAAAVVATDEYIDERYHDATAKIESSAATLTEQSQAAIGQLQREVVKRLALDESTLASIATTVTTTVPTEIATAAQQATENANKVIATATSTLQKEINALTAQLDALYTRAAADEVAIAQAQVAIATEQAQQVVDQTALAANQTALTQAQVDLATTTTAISTLHSQILATGSQVQRIQAAQQLNTAQLAPYETVGAVMLPTLLATLAGNLNKLKTKVDTCTVDTCDPQSPNNIRNVLKDLFGLMSAAGELGFIAEAVHNPTGTADAIAPYLDGIDGAAVTALDALLSL